MWLGLSLWLSQFLANKAQLILPSSQYRMLIPDDVNKAFEPRGFMQLFGLLRAMYAFPLQPMQSL